MTRCLDSKGQPAHETDWSRWPVNHPVRVICEQEKRSTKTADNLKMAAFFVVPPLVGYGLYKLTGSKLVGVVVGGGPILVVGSFIVMVGSALNSLGRF